MNLGEKIKTARAAKNMSQKELAKASGLSERTIQHYELGTKTPRSKDSYTKIAQALDVDVNFLLDDRASFVLKASQEYGSRGAKQAMELVQNIAAMWAGGEMEEDDMDVIMEAMQTAYWDAKKKNRKYINKKYRTNLNE